MFVPSTHVARQVRSAYAISWVPKNEIFSFAPLFHYLCAHLAPCGHLEVSAPYDFGCVSCRKNFLRQQSPAAKHIYSNKCDGPLRVRSSDATFRRFPCKIYLVPGEMFFEVAAKFTEANSPCGAVVYSVNFGCFAPSRCQSLPL